MSEESEDVGKCVQSLCFSVKSFKPSKPLIFILTEMSKPAADKHPLAETHTNHPDRQSLSHSVVCRGEEGEEGAAWPQRVKVKFNTRERGEERGGRGVQTERPTDVMSSSSRPPHTLKLPVCV